MSSSAWILLALLAVSCVVATAVDEDFAFDVPDDLEVEFPPDTHKRLWGMSDISATVGRIFHLAIPKDSFSGSVKHYEAKTDNYKPLPSWLLFDKTGGIFWGVPLAEHVGVLHISVKAVRQSDTSEDEFTLVVNDVDAPSNEGIDKCPSTEDSTVLTLIIDKDIKAIKPKQRIIAINNIAKFFGISYTAFVLKPQQHPDDITDSSVVLAGPGSLKTRTSQFASLIQVTVGCEGRLWLNSAPIIHQLKQQARDGTISEVLRLPLVGWRVKTETRPLVRAKRQEESYVGSGDYEEYYDDYDEYDDPEKDSDEPTLSSSQIPTTTTASTSHHTTVVNSRTYDHTVPPVEAETHSHPHRHHHGEIKPLEEETIQIDDVADFDPEYTEATSTTQSEEVEMHSVPHQTSSTAVHTTASPETDSTDYEDSKSENVTPVSGLYKPSETLDSDDEYDEEYEDDNDESYTELPITRSEQSFETNEHLPILPDIVTDTEANEIEITTTKPTTDYVRIIPETVPTTTEDVRIMNTVMESTEPPTTTEEMPPATTTTTTTTTTTSAPTTITTTTTTTTTTTPEPTTVEESTTAKHTTTTRDVAPSSTTTTQRATTQRVTETIEYGVKNFAPTIQIRLNRMAVTTGKRFSHFVPEKMFKDVEDEHNLKLEFLDKLGNPVNKSCWCQFNLQTREIYGLPLEEDVSRWGFLLKATDTEGASVSEIVDITVQQHKYWRVVNHEFSLYARVEKKQEFQFPVDWALHVLQGIGMVLHTTNTSKITVRSVNYDTDPIIFTWTNDSLATSTCPRSEIDELFSMLTANDEGDPSIALNRSLAPELRAKKVTRHLMGVCEEIEVPQPPPPPPPQTTASPNLPPILPPTYVEPVMPPSNLAPILRNAVDRLKTTIGELFLQRVPDDTFYDPEDVDPRSLKLHLYTGDREPIPHDHWLQFDSKNKEFFGIPTQRDARRSEYQLVCEDSGTLTASDTLIAEIEPAPKLNYNVEFSMTIEFDYNVFVASPTIKRKFVEKILKLFKDKRVKNVQLGSISQGSGLTKQSTIVTWYNKSLSHDECPWDDIKKLESLLVNTDRIISNHVHKTMDEDFPVAAFRLQNLGVCKTVVAVTTKVQDIVIPVEEGATQDSHDEYLITFIVPAVIISTMLLIAGIAACVLYRRRRSGKMNIEEDGRTSYGNKGIPVIFQEELDEKPEPGNKAPVILKDEKPPLAPPEYSKSGSLKLAADDSEPYQPPPPFTRTQDNGRQPRPKPTPTYRKPPPYVPP